MRESRSRLSAPVCTLDVSWRSRVVAWACHCYTSRRASLISSSIATRAAQWRFAWRINDGVMRLTSLRIFSSSPRFFFLSLSRRECALFRRCTVRCNNALRCVYVCIMAERERETEKRRRMCIIRVNVPRESNNRMGAKYFARTLVWSTRERSCRMFVRLRVFLFDGRLSAIVCFLARRERVGFVYAARSANQFGREVDAVSARESRVTGSARDARESRVNPLMCVYV